MSHSPAAIDRIRQVAATLDRYIARHKELLVELEQQRAQASTATGYEQMRAANNAKAALAKIAMYEPEIELLRYQLERMAQGTDLGLGLSKNPGQETGGGPAPRGSSGS